MAEQGELKLLSLWASPYVVRVRLALELKGLKYEILEENVRIMNFKSQLLLESNPVHKKVPVLLHNGKPICESMIIVQYLDEIWPEEGGRLLPKDAYGRAMARFWVDFIDNKLIPSAILAMWSNSAEEKAVANAEYVENCMILEELLRSKANGDGPFFGGNKMNYIDVAFLFTAYNMPAIIEFTGLDFPDSKQAPLLHAWMEAVNNFPPAKAVFPPADELRGYWKDLPMVKLADK